MQEMSAPYGVVYDFAGARKLGDPEVGVSKRLDSFLKV
jgi:hypothetical protein